MLKKFQPTKAYIAFDGGRNKNRLAILPSYKKRESKLGFDHEEFTRQLTFIRSNLPHFGVNVLYHKEHEADDLIYLQTRKSKKNYQVIIASGDKDFNQLIRKNVWVYNTAKDILLKPHTCKHYLGYSPRECVDWLCLDGDKSDNIPGVPKMGEKTIRAFLDDNISVRRYIRSGTQWRSLDNNKVAAIHRVNRKLIDLKLFANTYLKEFPLPLIQGKFNQKQINEVSYQYQINSFTKPEFIRSLKQLKP